MAEGIDLPREILRRHWGHDEFRGPQRAVIDAVVVGRRDALVVMATGGGKSVCMQVPPLVLGQTGLVVSPLIALMEDQVAALNAKGVRACLLGSAQTDRRVREDAWTGKYQLVYLTPELATSEGGLERIRALHRDHGGVSVLAVDEAHCISEWGNDFRPDFQRLHLVRGEQCLGPDVPVIAATATATPRVRAEIMRRLGMRPETTSVFVESFERPNLRFEAVARSGKSSALASEVVAALRGPSSTPAIVYVLTTRAADELADALRSEHRVLASAYHAKLDPAVKTAVHEAFLGDAPEGPTVVVATLAYGMGIDKPNVRTVVHAGAPASLEAYYQQSGRAGRDGAPARCVLLWSPADVSAVDQIRRGNHGQSQALRTSLAQGTTEVQSYVASSACRAAQLVNHFADDDADGRLPPEGPCRGGCDRCDARPRRRRADVAGDARRLLIAIRALNCRFGLGKAVALILRKTSALPAWLVQRASDLGLYREDQAAGTKTAAAEAWWKSLAGILIAERMLEYYTAQAGGSVSFSAPRLTAKGFAWLTAYAEGQELIVDLPDCDTAKRGDSAKPSRPVPVSVLEEKEKEKDKPLLEKPGNAAIETLQAYLLDEGRDVAAVAAKRDVKPSTVIASLSRCAAHGLMPDAELDGFAIRCGGIERGSETARALAACAAEVGGAWGPALNLARLRGLRATYDSLYVAVGLELNLFQTFSSGVGGLRAHPRPKA